MRAFVISCERNKDRQEFFAKQWRASKISEIVPMEFQLWPDRSEVTLDHDMVAKCPPRLAGGIKICSTQELALALSHLNIWSKCAEMGEDVLVFEDDCILGPNFYEGILDIMTTKGDAHFVFPGSGCNMHVDSELRIKWQALYPTYRTRACDCYILSHKAAQHYVDSVAMNHFSMPVDWELNWYFLKDHPLVYWYEPSICEQGSQTGRWKSGLR